MAQLNSSVKQRSVEFYANPNGKVPVRDWLSGLKDTLARAIITKRIRQLGLGQFQHTRFVGKNVWELKVNFGPGFRLYYAINSRNVIFLLAAGTKATQETDIVVAQQRLQALKERNK
jgi:putative addiction module killer protein